MLIDLIRKYPSTNLIKPMAQLRKFSDIIERIEHLQAEIEAMEPLLQRVEMHIQQVEQQQLPIIERYLGLMRRYFELDPVAALEEFREMLNRIRQRASSR